MMSRNRRDRRRRRLAMLAVMFSLSLVSCRTPQETRAIQQAAIAFRNESLAAIDAIETMELRALEAPPPTAQELQERFLAIVLATDSISDRALAEQVYSDRILQVVPPGPSPQAESRWRDFTATLRTQYITLATIYNDLEQGRLGAGAAVAQSREPLRKLTAQMVYFARCSEVNPPRLIRYRAAVAAELIQLRRAATPANAELTRSRILAQMQRLQEIGQEEQRLQRVAMEHALKAAVLGRELDQRLTDFNQLSLADISYLVPRALNLAASLTGQDTVTLRRQSEDMLTQLQTEPGWQTAVNWAFAQINQAIQPPGPPTPSTPASASTLCPIAPGISP